MESNLSKGKKLKTGADVRAEWKRKGVTIRSWCKQHGFSEQQVSFILSGKAPCHRGNAHKIAVILGIKDGVIEEAEA